ncbi:MAG: hypothetical protein GX130_03160 [Candidatus Hydrogenedens sp.]|jgi:tetratricopeptide (TPR) repeat protein|nr:hypothetical protein [Candidatus Hydrogenedens sp.]
MNHSSSLTFSDRRKEWIIAFLLFVFGFVAGLAHFESLRTDKSAVFTIEDLYGPAVMIAAGHGFINPDRSEYPELWAFLKGDQQSFCTDQLPADIKTIGSSVAFYHRYLLYAVGLFWRIFGVSWRTLEPFISLFLGWYALSLYFLFRFFLSRSLAVISTCLLTVSPAVFMLLLDLRDFSKAPFTITLFCLLLWLFIRRPSLRFQILGAVALGAVHGIFMGFRQDALIFFPLCALILIFPVFLKTDRALWKTLSPVFLYLCIFLALASPMFQHFDGNAQPQHVLVQGFARDRMDQLGIKQAPYQSLISGADYYTFAVLADFAARTPDLTTPQLFDNEDAALAGQRWLQESVFLYPADLATRGWTAIWRILRYTDAFPPFFSEPTVLHQFFNRLHQSFAFFMHHAGLPLAIVVFILLALQTPGTALFTFLIIAYILGYTALQAVSRHTFHLSFFPFLITGILIDTLIKRIRRNRHIRPLHYKGALIVLLLCASLILVPMPLLRWYQTRQLRPIMKSCIQAPRKALPFSEREHCGWTFFSLPSSKPDRQESELRSLYRLIAACSSSEIGIFHSRAKYLMAEFDGTSDVSHILHCYDSLLLNYDFSQLLHIPVTEQKGDILRYFFPIYEVLGPRLDESLRIARGHFTGIAVPKEYASQFRGLYEVHLPEDISHLMSFASVDNEIPNPLFYTAECLPDPVFYHHTEHEKLNNTLFFNAAQRFGTEEQIILLAKAQLILSNRSMDRLLPAGRLIDFSLLDESLDGLLEIETKDPSEKERLLEIIELIARLSLYDGETERCLIALDALEARAPERKEGVSLLKIEACERGGMKREALQIYKDYLHNHPGDTDTATRAHILLSDGFSPEEKHDFWKSLTDEVPDQAIFFLYLAMALNLQGEQNLAKEAYNKAYALDPTDPKIMISHTISQAENNSIEETTEKIKTLAAEYPENHILIFEELEKEAFYLSGKGLHHTAGNILLLASEYSPDPDRLSLKASQQFTGAGEYTTAEEGLTQLLEGRYATEVARALYVTVKLSRDFNDRVRFWRDLQKRHPENSEITNLFYSLFEERGRELFTSAQFKELAGLHLPENSDKDQAPLLLFYQTAARYLEGEENLENVRKILPGTKEEKAMMQTDLEALASWLMKNESLELSRRLVELMTFSDTSL